MIFKRKKDAAAVESTESVETPAAQPATTGPFDIADVPNTSEYLNFGSLLVKPIPGMKVRMEVEQGEKRVIAVSLEAAQSRIQLQAFAAPKSDSLWPGISEQIVDSIKGQNGQIATRDGRYGTEILARVPQETPEGQSGHITLRFIGVDGPRWFLRAVIGGAALTDTEAAGVIENLLASVVVDRGTKPLPPAELLPLNVPKNAETRPEAPDTGLSAPERGPEITQIG